MRSAGKPGQNKENRYNCNFGCISPEIARPPAYEGDLKNESFVLNQEALRQMQSRQAQRRIVYHL
jgi:hypothetical protein